VLKTKSTTLTWIYLPIIAVVVLALGACGGNPQPSGIPPAQATIWALNTQIALQETFSSLTLTAIANEQGNGSNPSQSISTPIPTKPKSNSSGSDNNSQGDDHEVAFIESNNVRVRTGPDLRFATNGEYQPGTACELLGRYNDWFLVKFEDGNQGWLYVAWLNIPANVDLNSVRIISKTELPGLVPDCKKYCN
jgi:hypothetical protein